MGKAQHISKDEFINILRFRMDEYLTAILGLSVGGMRASVMKTSQHINIQKIQSDCLKSNLYNGDFWGYGINSISDGNEKHSSPDVQEIKKIQELNKHLKDYRLFWLLTFKVENDALYVSVFCIDPARSNMNSNINTKFDLKDFDYARVRNRENRRIFVDFFFKGLKEPIYFQIETYAQGGCISGPELAQYYIDSITSLAEKAKENNIQVENTSFVKPDLNTEIDEIESKLRLLVVDVLEKKTGKENYLEILTGDHKNDLKRRIYQHVAKHPAEKEEDYNTLSKAIDFSDIDHIKKTISKDDNWPFFEIIFIKKEAVEKYFDQLSEIRHTVKHSRKLTNLVHHEGLAAMEWFNQTFRNL